MANTDGIVRVYEDLADVHERTGQAKLRDWFLVLAADAALAGGNSREAERLRGRLLQANPHHLLKPFTSFAEALQSPDIRGYVADLRRAYPPDAAKKLLQSQGRETTTKPPAPATKAAGRSHVEKESLAAEGEPQVYRLQPDVGKSPEKPINPRQAPPPRAPAQPAPLPLPPARSRPIPLMPAPRPTARPETSPWAGGGRNLKLTDDDDADSGAWVSVAIFGVVLLVGAALGLYTIARPFLPPHWLQ
jgi:hypothetical protein